MPASPPLTRKDLIRAAIVFLSVFAASYVLADHVEPFRRGVVDPFTRALAQVSGFLLRLAGYTIQVNDTWIRSKTVDLNIKRGCDGILASAVYLSAVLAYPTPWKARAIGLLLGLTLLHIANFVRILSLFLIQTYVPSLFDRVHVAFWQALMILIAVLIWSAWERRWGYPARKAWAVGGGGAA